MARRVSVIPRAVWDAKARQKASRVRANGRAAINRPSVERLDVRPGSDPYDFVVGVDPGGRESGVTMLGVAGGRAKWVTECMLDDPSRFDAHCTYAAWSVEAPNVIYPGMGLATGVLMTAIAAGVWYGCATARLGSRAMLSPQSVRIALCGRAGASDADVARALAFHIDGIPKRTNSHVRDAAAVALVGWWRVRAELQRLAATRPAPPG